MPSQLVAPTLLEQGLPGGKEFFGRHRAVPLGFEPEMFWILGVTANQEKGNRSRFTYFITQKDIKMCQWLVSGCLGDFTPVLGRKSCRHPSLSEDKMFASLQTNHGPHNTPQNLMLRDAVLLIHPPAVSTLLAMLSSSKPFPGFPCQDTCCGTGC